MFIWAHCAPARSSNAEQAASAAPPTHVPAVLLRAFVLMLAYPAARDDILRKTPGLKDLDYQSIFGAGGGAKLSVNALWPDPIHKLLKHATTSYKQLGHLRPVVKNLTVFMRQTRNGQLIPVACEPMSTRSLAPMRMRIRTELRMRIRTELRMRCHDTRSST